MTVTTDASSPAQRTLSRHDAAIRLAAVEGVPVGEGDTIDYFCDGRYARKNGWTYRVNPARDEQPETLSLLFTGTAEITDNAVVDDGDEMRTRRLTIQVTVKGRVSRCTVSAAEFYQGGTLCARLIECAGPALLFEPGVERRVPHVIGSYRTPEEQHVRQHTGWYLDQDGHLHYLDALGDLLPTDIGATPPRVDIPSSELPLRPYRLRRDGAERDGWEAFTRCLQVAPRRVTIPLFAHTYLSPLLPFLETPSRLLLWLLGQTGERKTELAKIACGAFGHFQGGAGDAFLTWGQTYGQWEAIGHVLKDMLLLIDDYKIGAIKRPDDVTRLIQHYSTSTSRLRRRPDMTAAPSTRVRANLLATGEDMPILEPSVAARMVTVCIEPGDVDLSMLSQVQRSATNLHGLTVGYVRWLARSADVRQALPGLLEEYRQQYIEKLPSSLNVGRIAESLAILQLSWECLINYALEAGLLEPEKAQDWQEEAATILLAIGTRQAASVATEALDSVFLGVLQSLHDQGVARFTVDADVPHSADDRPIAPSSAIIGHVSKEGLALFSGETEGGTGVVAYRLVQEHIRRTGATWPHSWNAVAGYLRRANRLAAHDPDRNTTVRVIDGQRRRVVLLRHDALSIRGVTGITTQEHYT